VLENRFLQSFYAVAASVVLVCGTLILLTSTAPWGPALRIDSEPSTPDSASPSTQEEASIDGQPPGESLASDQADTTPAPEPDESDRTYTASTGGQPDTEAPRPMLGPDATSPVGDDALASLGIPLNPDTIDTDPEDVGAGTAMVLDAASASEGPADKETPTEVALSEPETPAVADTSNAATDQIAKMMAALPPAPPAPVASDKSDAATVEVAAVLAATPPAPAVVAVVAPPPPLPKRKPAEGPPAPKEAALAAARQDETSELAATQEDAAQQEVVPRAGTGPWKPMALAPADKPSIALSKAPINKPSGTAYAATVWSALARHKPKAGQRGSTTVIFAIGDNGALRAVRVGRSSGNTRLDQLALATVRNAAPYPPPPSGAASYTIRIDFQ